MASKKSEFELLLRIVGSMDPSVVNAANMTKRQLQKMKSDIDAADSALWGGLTKAAKIGVAAIAAAGAATAAFAIADSMSTPSREATSALTLAASTSTPAAVRMAVMASSVIALPAE